MPYILKRCRSCHYQQECYHNVLHCPKCGGSMDPDQEPVNRDGDPVLTATQRRQVRAAREAKGFTRRAMADLTGLGYTTIVQVEHGHGNLRLENLRRLCEPLGLSVKLVLETTEASGDVAASKTKRRAKKP